MKFFKAINTETASEADLKKRLVELDDAALEQSYNNSQLSGQILEIDTMLEIDLMDVPSQEDRIALRILGTGLQDRLRENLKLGDEVYSNIESERNKIKELLRLKNEKNTGDAKEYQSNNVVNYSR